MLNFTVLVDASDECHIVNMDLQGGALSRSWDIKGETFPLAWEDGENRESGGTISSFQ